ncbi:MAG TPA: type II CRISPR RNA-guided endonuclease Cas9, partial [Bacilli bacterium]
SFFRPLKEKDKDITNYANYIENPGKHTLDKLYKTLLKILDERKEELKDNFDFQYCLEEIENERFLKVLNTKDNGAIPYQLHKLELEKIIENQSCYYPILEKEKDKLISLVSFRIPYYIGPLNKHSQFSWIVRKDDKIYPWNFNEVVDVEKSAENFIERMKNKCTYLPDEPVLPKKSLLISEFNLLDELNKIRVDGNLIPEDTKREMIEELFKKRKNVNEKAIINFYKQRGLKVERVDGFRKEKEFSANLSSYIDFVNIFKKVDEDNYEMIENIINWITLFTDKKILRAKIEREYPKITSEQLKKIEKLNYSGWSRFSRKLIDGISVKYKNSQYVTILELMRKTNLNFMQIISDKQLGFSDIIDQHNKEQFSNQITLEDINNIQGSPAIKKAIWQTIKIVDEIVSIMKAEPVNIFVEVTRSVKESKRTQSRVDKLLDLYNKISEESEFFNEQVFTELKNEKKRNAKLDNEKLFLYYIQNGKCMYTRKPLDIDKLSLYEVDHILPRSLIKDDSIDNKVLVISSENQRKDADLLLDYQRVIQPMRPFWDFLYRNKLISWKKYHNLTRTVISEEELKHFVNRQLVETSQININVVNLLHDCYKNVDISLVKAQLTSQFRKELSLYKIRELNDYHHAHDAYLTTIIGSFLTRRFKMNKYGDYMKFGKRKELERKYSSGYFINSFKSIQIDEDTQEVIWNGPKTIDKLRVALNYKDCFISKKPEEQTGEFYDQTIYDKKKGKVELKKGLNPSKYGGYSSLKEAYSVIVEYQKNKKLVRELIPVYVKESYEIKDDDEKLYKNLLDKLSVDKLKIIRKRVLKNQMAFYKNHPVYITSSKEMDNAKQLLVDQRYVEFIYNLCNNLLENNESNNSKINELYHYLQDKIKTEYPLYINVAKKFEESFPIFEKLKFEDKRLFIIEMLGVTSTNSAISKFNKFNVPIAERVDRLRFNRIDVNELELVDTSITGVFSRRIKYGL